MATIRKCNGGSWHITATVYYHSTWTPPEGMSDELQAQFVKAQAESFEKQCRNSCNERKIPIFRDFCEQWLVKFAPMELKARTLVEYRRYAQRACQEFGQLPITKMNRSIMQEYVYTLEQETVPSRSAKTIKNYVMFVSSVMNHAYRCGYISANPCVQLILPKSKRYNPVIYNLKEAEHFLRLLTTDKDVPMRYRVFFILLLFGGYREGELLGFTWDDFDFENKIITVQREGAYTKEKGLYTDEPKTERSKRCNKMPDFVMNLLLRYQKEREVERLSFLEEWKTTNRVFVSSTGRPLFPSAPLNWLRKFEKKHHLKRVNIHSFRHLNASLLITGGIDAKTVSEYLGHSDTTTTLNIYAHTFAFAKANASKAITSAFPAEIYNIINEL